MRIISKFNKFNENAQRANKEFPDDIELIEYVSKRVSNKNYIYDIIKIYNNSITTDIDNIISEYELYIKTKTYLRFIDISSINLETLIDRNKIYTSIDELPKLFKVNNIDIRDYYHNVGRELEYLVMLYHANIVHKNINTKAKIDRIISSSNKSISSLIDLIEDKYSIDGFDSIIDESIMANIEERSSGYILESDILYNKDHKYIIRITSSEAMVFIGSNSFWCHAYTGSDKSYQIYSYDGDSLVFIDYKSDDVSNIVVATRDFYNMIYNSEFEYFVNMFYDDRDEYIERIINDDINIGLYNRHNELLYDPILYLKSFLQDDFSVEYIENLL